MVGRENRGQSVVVKVSQRKQYLSYEEQEFLFHVKILKRVFQKEHSALATTVIIKNLTSKKSMIMLRWTNPLTIRVTSCVDSK